MVYPCFIIDGCYTKVINANIPFESAAVSEAKFEPEIEETKFPVSKNTPISKECDCEIFISKYINELYECKKSSQLQRIINNAIVILI